MPARGVDDLLDLKDLFIRRFERPERTFGAGASMGGGSAQIMAEQFPGEIDGAFVLCGALSNAEVVDFIVSWHAVAHWLIGAAPSRVDAAGLVEWARPLGAIEDRVLRLTPLGEQFAAVMRELSGGERWGFRDGVARQWRTNFGLGAVYWPVLLAAGEAAAGSVIEHDGSLSAFDTTGIVYEADPAAGVDLDALNDEVLRFSVDAALRADPGLGVATGRLPIPLLSVKTTGDLWTPISLDRDYARRVRAAGDGGNLIMRAVRHAGHCNFNDVTEGLRGMLDLMRWVDEGERPRGEDLSGDDLRGVGTAFTNPFDEGDPLASP